MNIQKSLGELKEELRNERVRHSDSMLEIGTRIKQLQETCPHPKWEYHPDASGNNDSWNTCAVCEKED